MRREVLPPFGVGVQPAYDRFRAERATERCFPHSLHDIRTEEMDAYVTPQSPDQRHGDSLAYRGYFLFLLTLAYVFNFADRLLLSILLEPIKSDLTLADWQLGVLGGASFAIFYVTLAVPLAAISDRFNRVTILSCGVVVWSLATSACGAAGNFLQLMLIRIGVAAGEAAGTPPSISLIGDTFPPERRATANSIFLAGGPLGIALGLALGGWLSQHIGWRMTFVAVGLPGIALAILIKLTLREPRRGGKDGKEDVTPAPPVLSVVGFLLKRPSFIAMAIATGIAFFAGYGMNLWVPSLLIRSHGATTAEAGMWLGGLYVITGIGGPVLMGLLADRLCVRNKRWLALLPAIALFAAAPAAFLAFTADSFAWTLFFLFINQVCYHSFAALVYTAAQAMVGLRMRAVTTAILLLIINVIGMGLGPTFIGWISDALYAGSGDDSLRLSLLMVTAPVFIASSLLFFVASRRLSQDLASAPA